MQELGLKMGGGLIREGGRISGILRYILSFCESVTILINDFGFGLTYMMLWF